jgi:hypothetical protein
MFNKKKEEIPPIPTDNPVKDKDFLKSLPKITLTKRDTVLKFAIYNRFSLVVHKVSTSINDINKYMSSLKTNEYDIYEYEGLDGESRFIDVTIPESLREDDEIILDKDELAELYESYINYTSSAK